MMLAPHGAFRGAVLMNDSGGAVLVAAMQRRKDEAHGQEYKKSGDEAVPFHDPEKRAQHAVQFCVNTKWLSRSLTEAIAPDNRWDKPPQVTQRTMQFPLS